MAAYSAIASFRQTLEELLDSAQFPPHVPKPQIESLREKVSSLQSSLDKIPFVPKLKRDKMKDLQNSIREAIYAAQDEVEYWIKDDSPHKSDEKTMKKLEEGIKLVEADALVLEEEIRNDPTAQNLFSDNPEQVSFNFSGKDKIVGQEKDFKLITEWLDSDDKSRLVIPITGLPGIGKTTLARSIYDNKEVRKQFNIRAWVTVSQDVNYQEQDVSGLERVAQRSVEDLIGRNLLSIRKKSTNGGMKACGMHDSLRELAEKQCGFENFFHARKKYNQDLPEEAKLKRRVSVHRNILMCLEEVYDKTRTITYARSLLYLGSHHHHPMPFFLTFDLLKVLDAFTCYFIQFPDEFLELVHLTYLSFTYNGKLPTKVTELKKLETLMVRREPKIIFVGASFLPDDVWNMPKLRHLWFTETDFPNLPSVNPTNKILLYNLQTLASVDAAYFTEEVIDNMPNLRKLAMWIESPEKLNFTVSKLKKLEQFRFIVLNPIPGKGIEVEAESFFPKKLRRITLSGTGLPWAHMEFLGKELKGLEVLKLKELAFNGPEWLLRSNYDMENLKYLLIEYLNFQKWDATNSNFPSLQKLIMRHCYELEDIPDDIGYIGPLDTMEVVDCSPQAVECAYKIIDQQEEGNCKMNFEGRVFSSWE
ncbi:hypothetical protein SASPL_131899 [Salvia splendens]|uniref:Disease resistance protein RPM1 n=1 Tax=Salvia splendens TaxID=180675 RepID=A0A8X8XB12_SALSN|nr:hypothetical protein SASPL_131899 [Salvia splendens]